MKHLISKRLTSLPRNTKRTIVMLTDGLVFAFGMYLVVAIVKERLLPTATLLWFVGLAPVCGLLTFRALGVYDALVRYFSVEQLGRIAQATFVSAGVVGAVLVVHGSFENAWKILINYAIAATVLVSAVRLLAAKILHLRTENRTRVIIYGAGDSGRQTAAALVQNGQLHLVGFVDDSQDLQGRLVLGIRVYNPALMRDLQKSLKFERILLCIPSLDPKRRRTILTDLGALAVKVLAMPGFDELDQAQHKLDQLKPVEIDDLLGREPVAPDTALMNAFIRDQVVMVTGAGGTIGSELCRQVIAQGAKKVVLFDISELALYQIERELTELARKSGSTRTEIVAVLGNVIDQVSMQLVLTAHHVSTVYHAAAYKHVPLVENNIFAGIRNNVFGTLALIKAIIAARVSNFVLVSSDKAVRPTSVMGASKRLQEMIAQAHSDLVPSLRVSMVRFGNVLASSGSVVPLFSEQIRAGGPVTVTHPEVVRYFMTIREAAELVIQAGAMGRRGDLFVLDMGEPVRILELAHRMIHLSGLEVKDQDHPEGTIEVNFSGLRPGEKLYEELLIGTHTSPTAHPRIQLAKEAYLKWPALQNHLQSLSVALDRHDQDSALSIMSELVEGFGPIHADPILRDPRLEPVQLRHSGTTVR